MFIKSNFQPIFESNIIKLILLLTKYLFVNNTWKMSMQLCERTICICNAEVSCTCDNNKLNSSVHRTVFILKLFVLVKVVIIVWSQILMLRSKYSLNRTD